LKKIGKSNDLAAMLMGVLKINTYFL